MPRTDAFEKLNLTDGYTNSRLQVDLESFFDFSFWMAEQLEEMVEQYRPSHLPPPKALGRKPPTYVPQTPLQGEN